MARNSADRDDLMAELVTLAPRVAFTVPDVADEIVAGRRNDGRWSIFFGGDPVYHFDPDHRLRRAFVDGLLYRSEGATLARLTRQPTAESTVLLRHDLTASELNVFLMQMRLALGTLLNCLRGGRVTMREVVPIASEYLGELADSLQLVLNTSDPLAPSLK